MAARQLIESDHGVFYLRTERLVAEDVDRTSKALRRAGLKPDRVRLSVHEGRGVVRIDFSRPVSLSVLGVILEAEDRSTMTAREGFVFRAKELLSLRPDHANPSSEAYELEPGDQFLVQGYDDTDVYYIAIITGVNKDRTAVMTFAEWIKNADKIEKVGELDARIAAVARSADNPKKTVHTPNDPKKAPVSGATAGTYMTVRRDIPGFPTRRPFDNYLSKFMSDIVKTKKAEAEAEAKAAAEAEAAGQDPGAAPEGMDVGSGRPTSGPNFFGR